jgi:hypothetical protein
MVFGLSIFVVGIIALLVKANVISGSVWGYAWPAILIIIGLSCIMGRFQRRRWFWRGWCPPWDDRDKDKHE